MKNLILETMKYCFTGYNQFLICETKTQAKSYLKQNSSINRIKDLKVITDEMRKEILNSFENFFHTVYDISSGYAVPLENEIDEADEEAALGYPNGTFRVICSTADGNQTKEFSNWEDAHQYANEWMDGFTHWNHRHFNNVESSEYVNLWKTRNGETVKIQEIKSDDCPNCADQASIAAPGQTTLCKTHSDKKHYADMNEFFESILTDLHFSVHIPFCSACGGDEAYYIGYTERATKITHFSFCKDCRSKLVLKQNAARAAQERIGA